MVITGGCPDGSPLEWHFADFFSVDWYGVSLIKSPWNTNDGWKGDNWYKAHGDWKPPTRLWPLVCKCSPPPVVRPATPAKK